MKSCLREFAWSKRSLLPLYTERKWFLVVFTYGRSKSFAEQWDEGLADESLYRDDNGDLIVKLTDGSIREFSSGEVTLQQ